YQYDDTKLHILFRAAKGDLEEVFLTWGDPFDWQFKDKKASWVSTLVPMIRRYQTDRVDYFFIEIEPYDYRCKYAFLLKSKDDLYMYGSKRIERLEKMPTNEFSEGSFYDLSNYFNYPYLNKEDLPGTPPWVKDTVWYQIFPDRFYSHSKSSKLPWGKLPVN